MLQIFCVDLIFAVSKICLKKVAFIHVCVWPSSIFLIFKIFMWIYFQKFCGEKFSRIGKISAKSAKINPRKNLSLQKLISLVSGHIPCLWWVRMTSLNKNKDDSIVWCFPKAMGIYTTISCPKEVSEGSCRKFSLFIMLVRQT